MTDTSGTQEKLRSTGDAADAVLAEWMRQWDRVVAEAPRVAAVLERNSTIIGQTTVLVRRLRRDANALGKAEPYARGLLVAAYELEKVLGREPDAIPPAREAVPKEVEDAARTLRDQPPDRDALHLGHAEAKALTDTDPPPGTPMPARSAIALMGQGHSDHIRNLLREYAKNRVDIAAIHVQPDVMDALRAYHESDGRVVAHIGVPREGLRLYGVPIVANFDQRRSIVAITYGEADRRAAAWMRGGWRPEVPAEPRADIAAARRYLHGAAQALNDLRNPRDPREVLERAEQILAEAEGHIAAARRALGGD